MAVLATLGGFLLLFAALQLYARVTSAAPETTRKLFHVGVGALTLPFPWLFRETWPVLLLTGASGLLLAMVKFVPALRHRLGGVAHRVDRTTLGELYFPLSVALLFWWTRDQSALLFVIPMMMLTLADATGALVGARYGLTPYFGASKSLEGSIAFVVVAFFCVHVPLLLWSTVGRPEALLIATTLALLVMLLEGSAWRGLDNLFIPIGGYFLLRVYMSLDATELVPRLVITVALVLLIVVARQRTTMADDALVAAAFLCYVAWAVMGWRWLIGPLALVIGYRWLSPRTAQNSRRMHDVPAVLSVWAPAIGWLVLAHTRNTPAMLGPYTVVFGAHLAIFGVSRLAFQFPRRSIMALVARAVVASWVMVVVPTLALSDATAIDRATAFGAIIAIAIGAATFVLTQADIRCVPQTARRWLCQTAAAAVASAAAWAIAAGASRALA